MKKVFLAIFLLALMSTSAHALEWYTVDGASDPDAPTNYEMVPGTPGVVDVLNSRWEHIDGRIHTLENYIISIGGLIDTFAELDAMVADKSLVNKEDAVTWAALGTFGLGITITTGDPFTLGTNRIDNGSDLIDGEMIADNTMDEDAPDWGTGADQISGADIPFEDAGSDFTATDLSAAITELHDTDGSQHADVATNTTHAGETNDPHSVTKAQVGLTDVLNIKHKIDATQAPTVNNDVDEGYTAGSTWTDVTNDLSYTCLDNSDGAANWTETTEGVAGSDTQVQYNDGGSFGGEAAFTYDKTTNTFSLSDGFWKLINAVVNLYETGGTAGWNLEPSGATSSIYTIRFPDDQGDAGQFFKIDSIDGTIAQAIWATPAGGGDVLTTDIDTFAEIDAIVADKTLVNEEDAADFGAAPTFEIPNAEANATLTAAGQIAIDGAEDAIAGHFGAGGEIAGEAQISAISVISIVLDPGAWYDTDTQVFMFTVGDEAPNGIIIDEWVVSCNVDPDVEMDLDLKHADAFIGLANAQVMDVLDTTDGAKTEDTDANIHGGDAVPNGKVVYLEFGADPEGTCVQMIFEMWYHTEED